MTNFQVGTPVRIKPPGVFGVKSIKRAFEKADMKGRIIRFSMGGIIVVQAENSPEWEYFDADELELIEAGT